MSDTKELYLTAEPPAGTAEGTALYEFGGQAFVNTFPVNLPDGMAAMHGGKPLVKVVISVSTQEAHLRGLPECLGSMLDLWAFQPELAKQICTVPVSQGGAQSVVAVAAVTAQMSVEGPVQAPVTIAGGEQL